MIDFAKLLQIWAGITTNGVSFHYYKSVKFIANWAGNFIKNQAIFSTTWGRYYKLGKLYNFGRVFQINAVITNQCWTIESSSGFESWTHGLVIQCPHPCLLLHASTRPLLDCSFSLLIFLRKHIKGYIPAHYLYVNENSKNAFRRDKMAYCCKLFTMFVVLFKKQFQQYAWWKKANVKNKKIIER